ncbi:hypothetical protein DV737_g339, partial [Chaetothyriales sp. CBS 132003]
MKKPSVSELVLRKVHRPQKPNDTTTFLQLIQRCLVPEVREEVQRYFGKIDCLEAQYPGLDYTFAPHRRRLAFFPWHRRLFRAFDELGLTSDEILSLCTWEGTRAAKERYERESHRTIEITTLHGVCQSDPGRSPRGVFHHRPAAATTTSSARKSGSIATPGGEVTAKRRVGMEEEKDQDTHDGQVSDDDDLEQSIGLYLNQRLMAAADARERGEHVRFDQQWEQWMKEALERDMDFPTILETIRSISGRPLSSSSSSSSPSPANAPSPRPDAGPEATAAASSDATSSLRPVSRRALAAEPDQAAHTPTLSTAAMLAPELQSYDQLHEMLDELQNSNARIAADNAALSAVHADLAGHEGHASSGRTAAAAAANRARLSTLVEELQTNTSRLEAENTAMANFLSRSRTETAR